MARGMPTTGDVGRLVAGRYAFERRLGAGGVGEVFLAHDTQLERWVALKRVHAEGREAVRSAQASISEARHLASIQHPNIVTVYDFVEEDSDVFVVMEFVHGPTLEQVEAPLTVTDFLNLARQALEGLSAAHSLGMIHRDIKSGNIMLATTATGSFQVKILDFGLAKIIRQPSLQTTDHSGSLLGSIYTMAPEQLEQEPIDARTDLYSLGCVFYRALTRSDPFRGDTVAAVMNAHLQHHFEPLAPLRPDLPPGLADWVETLFARRPADRPESAQLALAGLQALIHQPRRRPPGIERRQPPPMAPAGGVGRFPWMALGSGLLVVVVLAAIATFAFLKPAADSRLPAQVPLGAAVLSPDDRDVFLSRVGQPVSVEGVVGTSGISKSGTVFFLNFQGAKRGDLSLVFFLKDAGSKWDRDGLESLVGKRVRVSGTVTQFQGNPQIKIEDADQIKVL